MKSGIVLKSFLILITLLFAFSSCSAIESLISPDNTWGMLIFGIIMLVFWGWVFVNGLGLLLASLGVILRFILTFFLPFNDWED